MKIVTGRIAMSTVIGALMIALMSVASAQQLGNAGSGATGAQSGSANNAGAAIGTTAGATAGPGPMPGVGTSAGATRGTNSAPAPIDRRANGTSLYMNPDPLAPNVTGRPAPPR
jgi:hypothetical protein